MNAAETVNSEVAPLAERALLLDVTSVSNRYIAVGDRGHVLLADQCEGPWRQVITPTRATLTRVFFLDARLGWAVGHDAVILRTEDGGWHWQQVYQDAAAEKPLFDILFLDAQHGFAVGAYGAFLESTDGGRHWQERRISEDDYHLYRILELPSGKLFLAGEAGSLYRSGDEGRNWQKQAAPYTGTFFGAIALREGELLVFGMRGNAFRSRDEGDTWEAVPGDTDTTLEGAVQVEDGTVWLVGAAGALVRYHHTQAKLASHDTADRVHRSAVVSCGADRLLSTGERGLQLLP